LREPAQWAVRQILVDENFCTNDPNVYAAGKNVAIMWQVFYQYTYTSELEMAEKVSYHLKLKKCLYDQVFLCQLIDILQLTQESQKKKDIRFSKPVLFHALLPMNHKLLKITIPKRYLLGKLDNTYSHVMSTYCNGDFCRIRMGTNEIMEEITCVTQNVSMSVIITVELSYF